MTAQRNSPRTWQMKITKASTQLSKAWSHLSRNPVSSAVIASLITAVALAAADTTHALLSEKPPPALVERAALNGGSWGPSRILYRCMPSAECIAPEHVAFDSIANDPLLGNEAYFMRATVLGSHMSMQNRITVNVGDTVLVRAFIENDAAINPIAGKSSLTARDTRFSLIIPTNSSSELPVIGHISAAKRGSARYL